MPIPTNESNRHFVGFAEFEKGRSLHFIKGEAVLLEICSLFDSEAIAVDDFVKHCYYVPNPGVLCAVAVAKANKPHPVKVPEIRFIALVIVLVSALLTASVGYFGAKLESIYLEHAPRFYDAVGYDLQNANIYLNEQHSGQLQAILHELSTNDRNVFRTLPLLVFAPQLLCNQFGQLATSLPLLFSFGIVLGFETQRRFRSVAFSSLAMISLFSFPGLFDPVNGYAANWLDMPAAMAMGVSVLALLNFIETLSLKSLALFGAFATITATARWSAAPYLAFYGAPVLLLGLFRYTRMHKSMMKLVLVFACTAGPGIFFVLYHVPTTYQYYSRVCFGMGASITTSLWWICYGLEKFLGATFVFVLAGLIATNAFKLYLSKPTPAECINLTCNLWYPLSLFLFICLILRSALAIHPMAYIVPALYVSALTANYSTRRSSPPVKGVLAIALIIVLVCQALVSYKSFAVAAKKPDARTVALKLLDSTLAKYAAAHHIRTYAEYDDERSMATLDCFYKYGWLPTIPLKTFSIHEAYFKAWYPKEQPSVVAQDVFNRGERELDLILIHDDVSDVGRNWAMCNPFSLTVSTFMSINVPKSPVWKKVAVWQGPNGALGVYQNRLRTDI